MTEINREIMLSNVRLSFPHLKAAHRSAANAAPKFSADFIMSPEHPGYDQFYKLVNTLATDKWGDNARQVMTMIGNDRKVRCFGSGSEKVNSKTFKVYDGYEGMVYVGANRDEATPPQMIKADGTPTEPMNTMEYQAVARTLYGGCRVNAVIKPWLQDNKHGRGVRCELMAIQFASDDSSFGEGEADVSSMFGAGGQSTASGSPATPGFAAPVQDKPSFM